MPNFVCRLGKDIVALPELLSLLPTLFFGFQSKLSRLIDYYIIMFKSCNFVVSAICSY